MRSYKIVIILAVVLVLLFGAYMLLNDRFGTEEDNSGAGDDFYVEIMKFELDDVKTITVENGDFTIKVEREDSKWKLIEPKDIRYNTSTVSTLALSSYSVGSSRLIEENASDLSKYGLDNPAVVTVEDKDDNKSAFEIGNKAPSGSFYYVKKAGENNVYTLNVYSVEDILISKEALMDKNLFNVDQGEITSLTMERSGQKLFDARKYGDVSWELSYPINAKASESSITEIVTSLSSLTAVEFVDLDPQSYATYGLDNPKYVFEFGTTENNKARVLLGNEDSQGKNIYAKLDGLPEVFTVSMGVFTFIDKPLVEIADPFVYLTNINEVDKITVDMDGYHLDINVKTDPDDKANDKFYVNGKDATFKNESGKEPFRLYYQALIGITIDEIAPDEEPTGEPEITIAYSRNKEPKNVKIEYVSKDENYYYVLKDDEYAGLLVRKSKFDKVDGLRDTYEKLMEGIEENQAN